MDADDPSGPDREGTIDRVAGVGMLVAITATVIAGATIWLLLTDPLTVATAVEDGEISPLVERLAEIIYRAIASLLEYL
ncbi:MAG TPA: hypothetical protein VNI78_09765 [Vicinamibacterales bacterium]|nr:hypothetical protein [Vicinamibacterales bacterium]